MSWIDRNLVWILLATVVVTTVALVGVVGIGAVVLFLAVLGGATVGALFGEVALLVGLATRLFAVVAAAAVALVVAAYRRASLPRSDRLANVCATLESIYPPLRRFDLSARFEPDLADRRADLEAQYVDGEISEREFERRVDALLDEADDEIPEYDDGIDRHERTLSRGGDGPDLEERRRSDDRGGERRREFDRE